MVSFRLRHNFKGKHRRNLISLAFLVVMFSAQSKAGKHILREDTTFVDDKGVDHGKVVRGQRSGEKINMSYPGTKWCGPGNTASGYDDLGNHSDVDKCCRDHDHCDGMLAGESKYNLTNNDYFTVLHCKCDKEFYKCLHELNTNTSNRIGKLYFTLRNHCYKDDYPIVDCAEHDTALFVRRCIRYILDESQSSRYQYFDLPLYNGKSSRNADDIDVMMYELDNEI